MTKKQQQFADEYLKDCNATRAYKTAFPNAKSESGIRKAASILLTNPSIKEYIEKKLEEISNQRIADVKEIMEFYTGVLRGEIKDQFGLDASLSDRLSAGKELLKRYERTEGTKKEESEGNGLIEAIKAAVAAREAKA